MLSLKRSIVGLGGVGLSALVVAAAKPAAPIMAAPAEAAAPAPIIETQPAAPRWEYKLMKRSALSHKREEALCRLGSDGWELITIDHDDFVFRRVQK